MGLSTPHSTTSRSASPSAYWLIADEMSSKPDPCLHGPICVWSRTASSAPCAACSTNKYRDLPTIDADHESKVVLADGRSVIANSKGVKWDRRFSVYHSPLIAVVCRAIYTEHRLGSALEYDDLPESLQTFYYLLLSKTLTARATGTSTRSSHA
jgi:hypothetical protein